MPRKYVKSNQCPDNRLNRPKPGKYANTVKTPGPSVNSDQWRVSIITGHCRSITLHIKSSETLSTAQPYQLIYKVRIPTTMLWLGMLRRPTPLRNASVYSQRSLSGFVANTVALTSGFPSNSHGPPHTTLLILHHWLLFCWDYDFESRRLHGCLSVVRVASLLWTDPSSRGVLPSVVCISEPDREALTIWSPWPTRG